MNVLFDTNILLDVLEDRRPFAEPAARLWSLAESKKIRAFISAISYNNVYYVVRRLVGKARALDSLCILRDVFKVVPLDGDLLDQSIDNVKGDFEDAIQYYSAIRARAKYLVTRNPKDFPHDGPVIVTPDELLKVIEKS